MPGADSNAAGGDDDGGGGGEKSFGGGTEGTDCDDCSLAAAGAAAAAGCLNNPVEGEGGGPLENIPNDEDGFVAKIDAPGPGAGFSLKTMTTF